LTRGELEDQRYDREFDGKPSPWVPDESDLEESTVTDRERLRVELLRIIVDTDTGALAVLDHLGDWFQTMAEEYTRTE